MQILTSDYREASAILRKTATVLQIGESVLDKTIWDNKELAGQGYITMAGRIPRAFGAKKMYGYELSISQRE